MSIIDIIVVTLLVIGLVWGFIKGFSIKKINFALSSISGGVAYLAGVPLGAKLMNTSFGSQTIQNLYYGVLPTTESFSALVSTDEAIRQSQYKTALTELKIPTFFQGLFTARILDNTGDVGNGLASSFAFLTLTASCFLIIYLVCFILLHIILKPLWGVIFGKEGKGFFGRVIGMLFSASKVVVFILIAMIVLTLVDQVSMKFDNYTIHTWLSDTLKLEDTNTFTIGKFFYKTASSLLTWISQK